MTVLSIATTLDKMLDAPVHVRTDVDTITGTLYGWTRTRDGEHITPTGVILRLELATGGDFVIIPWHAVRDLRRASDSARRDETPETGNRYTDEYARDVAPHELHIADLSDPALVIVLYGAPYKWKRTDTIDAPEGHRLRLELAPAP